MATTATLTKINFMSEDSFNALSTLDNQQLYAVEATGLITSVMNSFSNYELVTLFENLNGFGVGDISLSQPFTNFPFIAVVAADDSGSAAVHFIYSSTVLNNILSNKYSKVDKFGLQQGNQGVWYICTYAKGSSTTLFKRQEENSAIYGIYGIKVVSK